MVEPDAAVAIVHTIEEPESVLLMRRAERDGDPWSGHWSFPGGRRDPEDRGLVHTALRELAEECGVYLGQEHLDRPLPQVPARRKAGAFLLVAPFVFRVPGELPTVLDPREAVEGVWTRVDSLTNPARHRFASIPGVPPDMLFPCIPLAGMPLWGFTYRLMTQWLGLCAMDSVMAREFAFAEANAILQSLVQSGSTLVSEWQFRDGVQVASIRGSIDVPAMLDHFTRPGDRIPQVNMLEVRPEYIRVTGLAFEEYLIEAVN